MIYTVTEESGTKGLEQLAGSSSTGTPLGTWASFENDYAPNIEWLQGGTTFNPNTYPALAMYLGGNTVPERYDHNRPSDYETIALPTTSATAITMQYDGFITFTKSGSASTYIYINNLAFANNVNNSTTTPCYPFKKGDVIYSSRAYDPVRVKYYKHPLFIKATPTSADSDYEGTLNAIREFYVRNNTYSTEERLTGGVWIDGKPIYRVVIEKQVTSSGNNSYANALPSNIAEIVRMDCCLKLADGGYFIIPQFGNSSYNGYVKPTPSTRELVISVQNYIGLYRIVIEYTKTTD